ncbi:MAG: choice-of-anchor J domain-containing protein [Hyphomicrobiales bacterium]
MRNVFYFFITTLILFTSFDIFAQDMSILDNTSKNRLLNPEPADGAEDVFVRTSLAWTRMPNTKGYKVSLGTDNPPTNIMNLEDVENVKDINIDLLKLNTTYYWKIVPYDDDSDYDTFPVFSFTTISGDDEVTTFPFIESFEDNGYKLPEGWVDFGKKWNISSTCNEGEKSVFCSGKIKGNGELFTKVISLEQDMELIFAYMDTDAPKSRVAYCDTLFTEIAEVDTDGWKTLGFVSSEDNMTDFNYVRYDLKDYNNKKVIVRWRHSSQGIAGSTGMFIDHVIVREQPLSPIMKISMDKWDGGSIYQGTFSSTGKDLYIYNFGSGELKLDEFVSSNEDFHSDLNKEDVSLAFGEKQIIKVYYEPKVKGLSVGAFNINTNGGKIDFTLSGYCKDAIDFTSEDFEHSYFPPYGWMTLDGNDDDEKWEKGYHPYVTAHKSLFSAISHSTVWFGTEPLTPNDYLVMPRLSIKGEKELAFWVATNKADKPNEHLEIYVSTKSGHIKDFTEKVFEYNTTESDTLYTQQVIDLREYKDQDIYVAFVHNKSTANSGLMIDDVVLQDYQGNHDVEIKNAQLRTAALSKPFSDKIIVKDLDEDDVISYTIEEGPDWLSVACDEETRNGILSGLPRYEGLFDVKIKVTDGTMNQTIEYSLLVYNSDNYVFHDFESKDFPPVGWTLYDRDSDGQNWYYDELSIMSGHDSKGSAASRSKLSNSTKLKPDNWLITPKCEIKKNSYLSYWVASHDPVNVNETYTIYISETNNKTKSLIKNPIHTETISSHLWKQVLVDLSKYEGKNIYIAFRHHSEESRFILSLDDILTPSFSTGIQEHNIDDVIISPNPARDILYINKENVDVCIYDLQGKLKLQRKEVSGQMNISELNNGLYIIKVISEEGVYSDKLIIE